MSDVAIERIYKRLGGRIRVLRKRAGGSQEWLADRSGLVRTSIVNIEAGRQRVLFHQVKVFALALETTPKRLLRGVW